MNSSKLCFLAALLAVATPAPAQNFELRSVTLAHGGGTSAGGSYTFNPTIGQSVLGQASGGGFATVLGFHGQIVPADPGSQPDLQITPSLAPIVVTENIARPFALTVSNRGPATATGVQLAIQLPTGLRATSAINSAGACQIQGGSNVTCQAASVASNQSFVVQLTLQATPLSESANEFENLSDLTAVVSATKPDLNPADNALSLPVTVYLRLDWGDAGGSFPVTRAENGARHRYWPGYYLGSLWDSEGEGNHRALANWDDGQQLADEDGVVFRSPLRPGQRTTVEVTSSFAGFLEVWADFNNDGDWDDPGEHIFSGQSLAPGVNVLTFNIPAGAAIGSVTTRWRASTTGGLSYTGYGGKGEIEDHMMPISAPPVVVVGNLPHTALGLATMARSSNSVLISNLGTNGEDGVTVAVGRVNGWQGTLVHQLSASNRVNGNRIEWTAYGEKNGQTNELLMSGRVERTADCLALYADSGLTGASGFLLEALSNGVVIARIPVGSGRIAWLRPPPGLPSPNWAAHSIDWEDVVGRNFLWTRWWFYDQDWDEDDPDSILDDLDDLVIPPTLACQLVARDVAGAEYVISNADSMRISPINPTATVQALTRLEFRGVNSGNFLLHDEAIGHLGAHLHAGGGTTFVTESNRVRFLPDSNHVIQARALAPLSTDMTRHCLAFHTPGLALATPGSGVTFRVGNAMSSFGALHLSRSIDGMLAVSSSFTFTGELNLVVMELFNSTSRVARLSLPAGALGTLSGGGRIITAGAVQGRTPLLSVVFDTPMTFTSAGFARAATGLRVYPDYDHNKQVWAVLDRFDVETVNEQLMEWIDQVIIHCPGGPLPTLDRLMVGERPRLSFATEAGVGYVLESWEALDGSAPAQVQRVTGTGGLLTLEDPRLASGSTRFYRVVPAQESLWEGLRGVW